NLHLFAHARVTCDTSCLRMQPGLRIARPAVRRGSVGRSSVMEKMSMTLQTWIFGATLATVLSAKEPVSIRVSPAVSFAPANLIVRTRLEPDADNRVLEIVAD